MTNNKAMEGCGDSFEKWLTLTASVYTGLPDHLQTLVVTKLIEGTNEKKEIDECNVSQQLGVPKHNYRLMQSIANILHVDILSSLPHELNEIICSKVDGKSLLKACNVSQDWNRIISSLQKVWQMKCTLNGFKMIAASDWKAKYVKGQKILVNMQEGEAFKLMTLPIEMYAKVPVTSIIISGGLLYACATSRIFIWHINTLAKGVHMVYLRVQSCITCMCEYEPQILVCGHTLGYITISAWKCDSPIEEVSSFSGHGGPVTCLASDRQLRLIASGGCDGIVKLWCVCSRRYLSLIDNCEEAVSQVSFVPCQLDSSGSQEFSLVTSSRHSLTVNRCALTPSNSRNSCVVCHSRGILHFSTVAIDTSSYEIMRNYYLTQCSSGGTTKLIYTRRTSCYSSQIVVFDVVGGKEEKVICLNGVFSVVAAGKVYALLLSEDRISHYYFTLFNFNKNSSSAIWKLQRPMGKIHHPFQSAAENVSWLDDLGFLSWGQLIVACADTSDQINIVVWQPCQITVLQRLAGL